MKAVLCSLLLFVSTTVGRIPSLFDEDWKNYSPDQMSMDMIDSADLFKRMDLHHRPSANFGSDVSKNVHYYLYTKENETAYEITKDDAAVLQSSTFNPAKSTKILIHGFLSDHEAPVDDDLSKAYLENQDVNIVVVDWKSLAAPYYNMAVSHTKPVGKEVAKLIDFLVSAGGANVSDIHIIGHSLGAHVSGFAANNVKSGRITRITGLDPALPSFEDEPPARRLDPQDADIVDCVHTCGKYLGFYEPLCTYDFYANGGVPVQPGCGFDWYGGCSHSRSYKFYAASIEGYKFSAQACSSFEEVKTKSCSGEWTGLMGEPAPTTPAGLYYLTTSANYPYAK